MPARTKITLACRNYDGTNAILRGLVRPSTFDLEILEMDETARMFEGMVRGEYDVSEMSMGELVYCVSREKNSFLGIPVFPSRVFRHGFIFCNGASGVSRPQDLSGRKVGFARWVQTAAIWMRGILIEEYRVSPQNTQWYVASMHHWEGEDSTEEIRPRDGSVIRWLETRGKNPSEKAYRALSEGELDALGITDAQLEPLLGDRQAKRLFENYREVEASYYRKTRMFPIMHVLVVRNELLKKMPNLPGELFGLFCEARRWSQRWRQTVPSMTTAWTGHYMDEEREIFQGDPWAYGLEKNRHVIEKFLSYCYGQGISGREIRAEDLFARGSWDLTE